MNNGMMRSVKLKNRDYGIELLRCLLMLGIVLIHATAYSKDRCWWMGNICSSAVTAFVFISAWYGLRFNWRKIMSLVGTAVWCAAIVVGIDQSLRGGDCFIQAFMKQFSSYWFLWCYVVVMLLSPLINKALDACDNIKEALAVVLPVVVLVFGWNWIFPAAAITLRTTLPAPSGFGSHTFLTLTGIYIVGRFIRKWLIGSFPVGWKLVVLCAGLMAFVSLDPRLGRYCSPFSVVLAACWVLLFKEVKIPHFVAAIVRFVTPSLFAVYLLHVSNIGNSALVFLDEKCACVGYGGVRSIIVSTIVFVVCVAADMPRRTLLRGLCRTTVLKVRG